MKEEREERLQRTLDIFKDQMERVLDKDYGLIVVFGDGTGGGASTHGDRTNALTALSMCMGRDEDFRDSIKASIRALEHAERYLNNQ